MECECCGIFFILLFKFERFLWDIFFDSFFFNFILLEGLLLLFSWLVCEFIIVDDRLGEEWIELSFWNLLVLGVL